MINLWCREENFKTIVQNQELEDLWKQGKTEEKLQLDIHRSPVNIAKDPEEQKTDENRPTIDERVDYSRTKAWPCDFSWNLETHRCKLNAISTTVNKRQLLNSPSE